MSTIDLILLGILLEKPMSAYELAGYIGEKQIGRLLKISDPAIYKSCKRLFQAGLLNRKIVRENEQPEKAVYSINKKGEDRFFELMKHFSSEIKPFYLDFNAFLWNLEKIDKKQGILHLTRLRDELGNLKKWILQHEKEDSKKMPFPSRAIVKQYRMTITTLFQWSVETLEDYKKLKRKEKG